MKKILYALVFAGVFAVSRAEAVDRLLTCGDSKNNVVFQICGVKGCPATVTLDSKKTVYNFSRTKGADGSLTYATKPTVKPSCTIKISALKNGIRTTVSASCAKPVKGKSCVFKDVGATPTPTPTPVS